MKGRKLQAIFSILLLNLLIVNVEASTIDTSLYDEVLSGEIVITNLDSEDYYVTTSYKLSQLKDDGDEAYDYYVLETNSYFNADGNKLCISHSTNNAAIVFESADYAVTRLMGNENKFVTFFSELNNYSKVNCKIIDESENIWTYARQIYAMNRYFDNTYTFKNATAFRVMEKKDIQIDLKISGSFGTGEFKEYTERITYNPNEECL